MGEKQKTIIVVYTGASPNGYKIAITLEELGLSYELFHVDIPARQHKEPWFLAINPNGRIPALTDTLDDGTEIKLFESGSIQQYLVDRYDRDHKISYPRGTKGFYETANWLFFQTSGIGPMQGQANHFLRYNQSTLPEDYSRERYTNETRRLYNALDKHLEDAKSEFVVGDKCTVADIALWTWARILAFAGLDIAEFPNVQAWHNRVSQRPAVQTGSNIPLNVDLNALEKDKAAFGEYLKGNAAWIRQGMEVDHKN